MLHNLVMAEKTTGIMAWEMRASTAPPASACEKIATSDSALPMNSLPTAAATTPAMSTVDHRPKMAFGR